MVEPTEEHTVRIKLSYYMFEKKMERLVKRIKQDKKHYSGVYGAPRGGLPIAIHLSHHLGIPFLREPERRCLIVDDIADSGKTFKLLHDIFEDSVDYASIYLKPKSDFTPTYHIEDVVNHAWVVFPWEDDSVR